MASDRDPAVDAEFAVEVLEVEFNRRSRSFVDGCACCSVMPGLAPAQKRISQ
jgi:hypothetical protein